MSTARRSASQTAASTAPSGWRGPRDRFECEVYAIGRAADTGRGGPTWTRNGNFCTGAANDCENHDDNQFLLFAMGGGYYEACTKDGVCGGVQVDR